MNISNPEKRTNIDRESESEKKSLLPLFLINCPTVISGRFHSHSTPRLTFQTKTKGELEAKSASASARPGMLQLPTEDPDLEGKVSYL